MTTNNHTAMPALSFGNVIARLPIIQGGMAIRLSLSPLAAAVAEVGGIGIIAGSGLQPDELMDEIHRAREATDGIIGVNIMVAVKNFKELVLAALGAGVDLVIAGAGFSRDVFRWCADAGVAMVPVVSSARVAKLAERFGAAAVVLEGVEAGGHLGTDRTVRDLLPEVLEAVDIPVIAAGGIVDGKDIHEILSMGAAGVQMGSRFLATDESSAPDTFKQMYVDAREEDIVLVHSPVGLLGRAIRNPFSERLRRGDVPPIKHCIVCLKKCGKEYCIIDKLLKAQGGDLEEGLVFAGTSAARVHDIISVSDLMTRLVEEYRHASEEAA